MKRLIFPAVVLALAAIVLAPVHAQTQTQAPTTATAVPAAATASRAAPVTPIAVADILNRANDDQQRVDAARRLLAMPDPVERLRRELDGIGGPVDAKLRATAGNALRELPVMRLESLSRHWAFDARRFEHWESLARYALSPYGDSALQLAQRRAAWSATRAEGLLDGLPTALSARVDAMLTQIDETEAALGMALERQFALNRSASELKARIQLARNDVAAAIGDIDRRLLRTDVPPLWLGLAPGIGWAAAWAGVHRGIDIEVQFASDYHRADSGNQQALRIVQLLLLPLILWLVIRSRRTAVHQAEPARAARALSRPVSAWLLLSMLAVLALEPDAPLLVQELAMLVALVPVLRLLPAGMLRALGVWPYMAAGLYGLDRLGVAVVAEPSLYRFFLLGLNLLALGLTLWMVSGAVPWLSQSQSQSQSQTGRQRVLRSAVWAVAALLFVAAAANVVGNTSLAEMLTSGIIDSGYMALLLYAGVTACMGLARALLGQPEIANRRLAREHGDTLQAVGARLLVLGAVLGWLLYSLDRFRLLRPVQSSGAKVLQLGIDVGEVSIHLGDVLVFAVSAWLALWAARAVRRLLRDELPAHAGLARGAGNSIASLSYYGVLLMGLLLALSAAGFKVSQLALVFGALGVGIGFGLQNVVNNLVSGVVLMVERPIQPGDVVEVAGTTGSVRTIGLRATIVRTGEGADVVVPNGLLLSGNLVNWTMYDRSRRIEITLGVPFGSDPRQVLAILKSAAAATDGVAKQPEPVALMTGYGESALSFVVRAWVDDLDDWGTARGALLERTLADLQSAGFTLPYRQLDLHIHSPPPAG